MSNNISPRQKQILEYIERYITKNSYSPSLEEIAKHFKLAKSTIHQHVEALERKGYLSKVNYQARTIEIPQKEHFVRIPLLGTIAAGQPLTLFDAAKETIA